MHLSRKELGHLLVSLDARIAYLQDIVTRISGTRTLAQFAYTITDLVTLRRKVAEAHKQATVFEHT